MKILIICDSVCHGNTRKIADAMAEMLEADILASTEMTERKMREYDLIGFGSGIYMGKHYRKLLDFAESISDGQKLNAFIFSTSGFGKRLMESQHKELKEKLLKKGFNILGEFTCKGFDKTGPLKLIGGINRGRPNMKDIEEARAFAREVKAMVS